LIELDSQLISKSNTGNQVAVSGNAALARGLIESSVKVVTSYPGTPCAEVLENLIPFGKQYGIYIEWSVNEKVAFEVAASAAMAGIRSAFITKHAGMNWASDSLMAMSYAGVKSGMVIISADDPGALNSPIEQDTRFYARMAEILGLDPASAQEAKDMVVSAFEISEKLELPVFIRPSNRILYGRSSLSLGKIQQSKNKAEFYKDPSRWIIAGKNAVCRHQWLHRQQQQLRMIVEQGPFNKLEMKGDEKYGIITTGICYYYVKDALQSLDIENKIAILKLGYFNPLPEDMIRQILQVVEEVVVVEELEPFIEEGVKKVASELKKGIKIFGKLNGYFPETGFYETEMIEETIKKRWNFPSKKSLSRDTIKRELKDLKLAPYQQITFCPGCPHRAALLVLKRAIAKIKGDFIITTDIGCYIIGVFPPLSLLDTVFCMGASIGVACGFYQAGLKQNLIATIGDSTFLHAGIPALINCCYTGVDILVYILDNRTVAMTGLQPHPGLGLTAQAEKTKVIDIENIVKSCGVDYVRVIDQFNLKEAEDVLTDVLKMKGQRVVIARHTCAQVINKSIEQNKQQTRAYKVNPEKCKYCRRCIESLGCPAMYVKDNKVAINEFLCGNCGLCVQVCTQGAIIYSAREKNA